jgi:hypothetical protein
MTILRLTAGLMASMLFASTTWAASPTDLRPGARHNAGPITVRGVASHVGVKGFTLRTTSHGTYTVNSSPPTKVIEKGRTGRVTVAEGNHVGVRGYVEGGTIRAIQVRVYPITPKPFSVRGTIAAIAGNRILVRTGSGLSAIVVTGNTVIQTTGAILTLSKLRPSDRVEARVVPSGHDTVAIHIHVFRARAPQKHVQVRGTVLASSSRSVVVRQSGSKQTIGINSQTRYYSGTARSSGALKTGDIVTVYACCAGQSLVASSIHIRVTNIIAHSTELRGTVVAVTSRSLRLDSPHTPAIQLQSSTVLEVGAVRTTWSGVRVGDLVSVRGAASGGVFKATRVHIFAASRKVSTVTGTVTGVSASSLRVVGRGATYTVVVGGRTVTRLAGRPVPASQIRTGDRAHAIGRLIGRQLRATSVDVTRPALKVSTERGTMTSGGASWLGVTHSSGTRDVVRLDSHTRILFEGRQITGSALFPGMHVIARGIRSGNDLQASLVTVTAKRSSETGRFVKLVGSSIQLKSASGKLVRVDIPVGVVLHDGAHSVTLRQIGRGAYLHENGYVELSKTVRATTITVLHPTLTLHGILTWRGAVASVKTSQGDSYTSLFSRSSSVVDSHSDVRLRPVDIPAGTSVQVVGTVDLSGSLAVRTMTTQLHSATLRAKVGSLSAGKLSLIVDGGTVEVHVISATNISQGSRPLTAGDIVVGDDVTAYGYTLKGNVILARKLSVHRRLLGLDGIVASVTDASFDLTASDGSHTIFVNSTTLIFGVAGTALTPGMKVHVTGYLRGDAVVLATRVRILKSPSRAWFVEIWQTFTL